jgi:hypothetical protein
MRVACPQVISLYGVSGAVNHDDAPCLLMEYAHHGALAKLIKQSSTAPTSLHSWFRRMRILVDVAKGLYVILPYAYRTTTYQAPLFVIHLVASRCLSIELDCINVIHLWFIWI